MGGVAPNISSLSPEQLQKLQQLLGTGLGQNMGPQGPKAPQTPGQVQAGGGQGGGLINPGVVGRTDLIQPPKINYDPRGAGANMPPPAPPPQHQGYQPSPHGDALMQKLDPKGAATFNAIQGVSQVLQNHQQKKTQKEQQEAANIAQNLIQAVQSGNKEATSDILNDPKSTKVLNKVYKGWLQKAQEQNTPPERPDPVIQAFESGLAKYSQQMGGGGQLPVTPPKPQGQGQPQQAPPQQQQNGTGMPSVIGGYRVPQASPAQLMDAATRNAQLQYAKDHPDSLIEGPMTPERMAQQEKYEAERDKAVAGFQTSYIKYQTAQEESQRKNTEFQITVARGKNSLDAQDKKAITEKIQGDAKVDALRVSLEIQKQHLINLKQTGANIAARGQAQGKQKQPSDAIVKQVNAINQAQKIVAQAQKDKRALTSQEINALQGLLPMAGASNLAKTLPQKLVPLQQFLGLASSADDIAGGINDVKTSLMNTIGDKYPDWKGIPDENKGDGVAKVDDKDDSGDDDIEVTEKDLN